MNLGNIRIDGKVYKPGKDYIEQGAIMNRPSEEARKKSEAVVGRIRTGRGNNYGELTDALECLADELEYLNQNWEIMTPKPDAKTTPSGGITIIKNHCQGPSAMGIDTLRGETMAGPQHVSDTRCLPKKLLKMPSDDDLQQARVVSKHIPEHIKNKSGKPIAWAFKVYRDLVAFMQQKDQEASQQIADLAIKLAERENLVEEYIREQMGLRNARDAARIKRDDLKQTAEHWEEKYRGQIDRNAELSKQLGTALGQRDASYMGRHEEAKQVDEYAREIYALKGELAAAMDTVGQINDKRIGGIQKITWLGKQLGPDEAARALYALKEHRDQLSEEFNFLKREVGHVNALLSREKEVSAEAHRNTEYWIKEHGKLEVSFQQQAVKSDQRFTELQASENQNKSLKHEIDLASDQIRELKEESTVNAGKGQVYWLTKIANIEDQLKVSDAARYQMGDENDRINKKLEQTIGERDKLSDDRTEAWQRLTRQATNMGVMEAEARHLMNKIERLEGLRAEHNARPPCTQHERVKTSIDGKVWEYCSPRLVE